MLANELDEHRRGLVKAQHPDLSSGLVFPSQRGTPRHIGSLSKVFAAARKRAGIEQRVGAQVLRRSFNTMMVAAGVDRIVLRAQMGHSSEQMTERYAGVSDELKREQIGSVSEVTT